ncbi:MAG: hypothetical protein JKY53_01745 [Flavobacteriales bacterium]|nr:hypothetical protein [Flavobacteriales bacterium]
MKIVQTSNLLVFLLFILSLSTVVSGQAYDEFSMKEQYDDVFIGAYDYPPVINFFNSLEEYEENRKLTQQGGVLESMLNMYELTGDKAYLYKFMEWTTDNNRVEFCTKT